MSCIISLETNLERCDLSPKIPDDLEAAAIEILRRNKVCLTVSQGVI